MCDVHDPIVATCHMIHRFDECLFEFVVLDIVLMFMFQNQ
jgi:hypothetical protein